jgi:hypothetical protein
MCLRQLTLTLEPTAPPMRTRNIFLSFALIASAAGSLTFVNASPAAPAQATTGARYRVTVTNITRGQILGPIAVITHSDQTRLFNLGQPASLGLSHLAEEGDPSVLITQMNNNPEVLYARTNGAVTMPGMSSHVDIVADGANPYISLAGMLVSTNDGFAAVRDLPLPANKASYFARVYDAGSEYNSEDCNFIPGPPCASAMSHDPAAAEGFVRIHEGIHGIGGLSPEMFDWRDAGAEVTIERLNP